MPAHVRNRRSPKIRLAVYLAVLVALALALRYGRTRAAPDLTVSIRDIFPRADSIIRDRGVFRVYADSGLLIGWAGSGQASGYGGPMLLVTGIDTLGQIVGARVVEQRETPIFWRMARPNDLLASLSGKEFDQIDFDRGRVDGITGATLSSAAIIASVRAGVVDVAAEAFDTELPVQERPFEFGLLEITVLILFVVGLAAHRVRGTSRQRIRWATQIAGLLILGFWKDSPITLAKLVALLSGFFPPVKTSLALYLLIAGFLITSFFWGRNIYCLYACPFGAAQRLVGLIGGKSIKLPQWSVRLMEGLRNLIVFSAIFMAFLTLKPVLASYEPFAALFSLNGTTLQWILLFVVLVASLLIRTPWCNFFCPMRTFEIAVQDLGAMAPGRRKVGSDD